MNKFVLFGKSQRLLIMLPLLVACSKLDANPPIDFGPGDGLSYRTANGLSAGTQDPTDWTSDASWNERERALFPELSFDLNGAQQPLFVSYAYAYPNPAPAGVANWILQPQRTGSYTIRAVLVDRNYAVLTKMGPLNATSGVQFSMDYAKSGLKPDELYRLYYVVYGANGLLHKGHGDVRYNH